MMQSQILRPGAGVAWPLVGLTAALLLSACGSSDPTAQEAGAVAQRIEGGGEPLAAGSYTVTMPSFDGTEIFFTVFVPELAADTPAPLVIHSHGWGLFGIRSFDPNPLIAVTQDDVTAEAAEAAWKDGYFVISFDQRGWGRSGGFAQVQDPDVEGRDVAAIVDWAVENLSPHLAHVGGDPLIGGLGLSYGGGFQTIGAAVDPRWDAIIPTATWNDLSYSLNPGGVPKSLWATALVAATATAGFTVDPFVYQALLQGLLANRLDDDIVARLHNNGLASFCEAGRADGRVAPVVDAFFVQGLHDALFNVNEAYWNAECLQAAGGDVRLLIQRDGHILPLLQEAGNQVIFGVKFEVQCGDERWRVSQMMLDFLNEKLRGIPPQRPIPRVCITQDDEHGIVRDRLPLGGPAFTAAEQSLTTGVLPSAVVGLLQTLEPATLTHILAQLPQNVADLVQAVVAGLSNPTEEFIAILPALLNLLPYELLNELLTYEHFAELVTVDQPTLLAGIPEATLILSATLGRDPIVFVGTGVRRAGGHTELLHEQILPLRGAGSHQVQLPGISTQLAAGETAGLIVMPFHPQYATAFSRLPEPVTLSGSVALPLDP